MEKNTPTLQTERLILRRFTKGDIDAVYSIWSDPMTNTFVPMFPLVSKEEAMEHLQKNYLNSYEKAVGFRYAICLKTDSVPIGYVNVADDDSFDFGYGLRTPFWHQGIVTEACTAVVQALRATNIPYITATHDVNNPRSGHVMQKIGMRYCYSYEEQWQPKDILVTFRMYQLNLREQNAPVYQKYWNMYPVHFIEEHV